MSILLALLLAQSGPDIAVERRSVDEFVLTVAPFELTSAQNIQARLEAKAKELCGARSVHHGKFAFETKVATEKREPSQVVGGYRQEFQCVDDAAPVAAVVPDDWKPSETDIAAGRSFALRYFELRDAAEYDKAFAMIEPGVEAHEDWVRRAKTFSAEAGPVQQRAIVKLTWYVNPAGAPKPGVYLAVDHAARFPRLDTYCGYLILHRDAAAGYAITREETNILRSDPAGTPQQLESSRALLPCQRLGG